MDYKDCWFKNVCKNHNSEKCNDYCLQYKSLLYFFETSNLPENKWFKLDIVVDKVDEIAFKKLDYIRKNIDEFVKKGKNLLIQSDITGNGKSSYAIRLLQSYYAVIWQGNYLVEKGIFINTPDLLLKLSDYNIKNDNEVIKLKNRILNDDLVVFDEVIYDGMTEVERKNLLALIDQRYNAGKSCIYTSNVSLDKFEFVSGKRLKSRILEGSILIQLYGSDKRRRMN